MFLIFAIDSALAAIVNFVWGSALLGVISAVLAVAMRPTRDFGLAWAKA